MVINLVQLELSKKENNVKIVFCGIILCCYYEAMLKRDIYEIAQKDLKNELFVSDDYNLTTTKELIICKFRKNSHFISIVISSSYKN
jgi:hypothetical protein